MYKILFANGSESLQGDTKMALITLKAFEDVAHLYVLTVEGEVSDIIKEMFPNAFIQRIPSTYITDTWTYRSTRSVMIFALLLYGIRRYHPDVLYTYDRTMISPILCTAGLVSRIPFIFHLNNPEMFPYQRLRFKMVERAAAIWSVSEYVKRRAVESHVRGKHDVLLGCYTDPPLKISRQEARVQLGISENCFAVALVGRLSPFKGQETLIRAMAYIQDKNIHAYIAGFDNGDGQFVRPKIHDYSSYLVQVTRDLGVDDQVTFLGRRPGQLVFRSADVAVMPSDAEPFGLVVPEAMSSGVPIIATDAGAFPELLTHNETALLVPVRDPRRLADAIREYSVDPQRAKEIATAALTGVLPRLSFDRYREEAQSKLIEVLSSA